MLKFYVFVDIVRDVFLVSDRALVVGFFVRPLNVEFGGFHRVTGFEVGDVESDGKCFGTG